MKIRKGLIAACAATAMSVAGGGTVFALTNTTGAQTSGNSTAGPANATNTAFTIGACSSGNFNTATQVVSRSGSSCGGVSAKARTSNNAKGGNARTGNNKANSGDHF